MSDVYVTSEGLQKLKDDLRRLSTTERTEIAERIKEARDFGDLSENAEYNAAKDEQARNETTIKQLEEKIRNAVIFVAGDSQKVNLGSTVVVKDSSTKKVFTYTLVGSTESNPSKGLLSNESPIGKALLGKKIKQKVSISLPKGVREFTIVSVE